MAREYSRRKDPVRAVPAARAAAAGLPTSAEAQIVLGIATSQSMLLDDAVAAFEKAIELEPGNARAHFGLGMCFVSMGREPEAVAVADALHRLDPGLAKELVRELR